MEFLSVKKEDNVGIITINRPPANALSAQLLKELDGLFDKIQADDEVKVVVINGEGRFFSAGADINEFTAAKGGDDFANLARRGQNLFEKIESFPKPVIAAIHGAALGGGLELAMGCHIRIVTKDAKLGLPELQLGIIPGYGGTQRLTRLVGPARATEMMLTSDPVSGEDAVKYGLANYAFSGDELLEKTMEIAKKIALKSRSSVVATLKLVNAEKSMNFHEGIEEEAQLFGKVFETEDATEGIKAFLEKRPPKFTGK